MHRLLTTGAVMEFGVEIEGSDQVVTRNTILLMWRSRMRLIVAFAGIMLMSASSADAGCKIVRPQSIGNAVLTGVIRGFEVGPPPQAGEDSGIYLVEPCEFVIQWKGPYPKACKVGDKITAKGSIDDILGMFFVATKLSCKR